MAGACAQQHENLLHRLRQRGGRLLEGRGRKIRPARVGEQPHRHLRCRQHIIGQAGGHRAARHAGVFGRLHLLHHRHARLAFDRFQAERAVGARAGENDANRLVLLVHGQRAKEIVDRQMRRLFLLSFHPMQFAAQDRQVAARRADIDMVRLDLQPVRSLVHFEVGDLAQQLRQ